MDKAIIVAGMGFGDEGKGTMTEFLAYHNKASAVIRYNGGAQTAHNVVMVDGRHHTFHMFGSATLMGIPTFLSKYVLVDPAVVYKEYSELVQLGVSQPVEQLLRIDGRCLLVTLYHKAANRIIEMCRGKKAHGSTGMGIGEATADFLKHGSNVLFAADTKYRNRPDLLSKIEFVQELQKKKIQAIENLEEARFGNKELFLQLEKLDTSPVQVAAQLSALYPMVMHTDAMRFAVSHLPGTVVCEGAQGVLLDQDFGFQPHTTWSNTTFENAAAILRDFEIDVERKHVGVIRTYMTRHGAGPFPSAFHPIDKHIEEPHNVGGFAGSFRQGYLDLVLLRYANRVIGGVDEIALTHVDSMSEWMICDKYSVRGGDEKFFSKYGPTEPTELIVERNPSYERQRDLADALFNVKAFFRGMYNEFTMPDLLRDYGFAPVKYKSFGQTLQAKKAL